MITRTTRTAALLVLSGLAIAGCQRYEGQDGTNTTPNNNRTGTNNTTGTNTTATPTAPDNTDRNKVDRDDASKTPMDQGQNAADVNITAAIRKAIMDDSTMSVNAQNCKVITERGVVTLRGPVDSQAEKDAIEAKAKAVTGVTSVINQLEVVRK